MKSINEKYKWKVQMKSINEKYKILQTFFHRRMFPTVRAAASGLEPSQHYFVLMDIVLAEENR